VFGIDICFSLKLPIFDKIDFFSIIEFSQWKFFVLTQCNSASSKFFSGEMCQILQKPMLVYECELVDYLFTYDIVDSHKSNLCAFRLRQSWSDVKKISQRRWILLLLMWYAYHFH
jgi:hypothetical protein